MRTNTLLSMVILLSTGAAACSNAQSEARQGYEEAMAGTNGASGEASSAKGVCDLISTDEIGRFVGGRVRSMGVGGPLNTGCSWEGVSDEEIYVGIQVIPDTEYWETPHGARGYEELSGIARTAYVVPQFAGWQAGALTESKVAVAIMEGGKSTRESTIELLKLLLRRI